MSAGVGPGLVFGGAAIGFCTARRASFLGGVMGGQGGRIPTAALPGGPRWLRAARWRSLRLGGPLGGLRGPRRAWLSPLGDLQVENPIAVKLTVSTRLCTRTKRCRSDIVQGMQFRGKQNLRGEMQHNLTKPQD